MLVLALLAAAALPWPRTCAEHQALADHRGSDPHTHRWWCSKNTSAAAEHRQGDGELQAHFLELQHTDPKLRAEAMRRLGDLNQETGEIEQARRGGDLPGRAESRGDPLYTLLLKAYPDYARNDQVLYQMARAYETTGQPEQALATLDRIVARYPRARACG